MDIFNTFEEWLRANQRRMHCGHMNDEECMRLAWEGGRMSGPRISAMRKEFTHENPDGTRVRIHSGQRLYHRKTGGHYVLTSFGYREATMEFGFNYVSNATFEQYWRPIAELFDGRWIFWDGVSELPPPPPPCEHKRQMWNVFMTEGHCSDCGAPLGNAAVAAKQRELASSWTAQRALMDGHAIEEQPPSGSLTNPDVARRAFEAVFHDRPDYFCGNKHTPDDQPWMEPNGTDTEEAGYGG